MQPGGILHAGSFILRVSKGWEFRGGRMDFNRIFKSFVLMCQDETDYRNFLHLWRWLASRINCISAISLSRVI